MSQLIRLAVFFFFLWDKVAWWSELIINYDGVWVKLYTWWLIPLIKWVITPVISGLTLLIPFITGVITHLLSGMSHQVYIYIYMGYMNSKNHPQEIISVMISPHFFYQVFQHPHDEVKVGMFFGKLPSGKHTKNYGKSPFLMGKSTISINDHFQ